MRWRSVHTSQRLRKAKFYLTVMAVYGVTVFCLVGAATAPTRVLAQSRQVARRMQSTRQRITRVSPNQPLLISGQPVRIVIPGSNVDLPIDPGYYDNTTGAWTLSGYRAQFAMMSSPANNLSGDTFIYGHNNNYVFGALRHHTPAVGAIALIYTTNDHILVYSFVSSARYTPDDTSVLTYSGPATLTIQTCTGELNEWRTMYQFTFKDVQQ